MTLRTTSARKKKDRNAVSRPSNQPVNLAELLAQLGDISPERVRLEPAPGRATKNDLLLALERDKILCELVDGTLVEKPVGHHESALAVWLSYWLVGYLETRNLGRVYGPDAPFKLRSGLIRLPDVSFVSHDRLPQGDARKKSVATWVPDLAVEILSKGNSRKEIERKLDEYFSAGVILAWVVDPRKKTVKVYTDRATSQTLDEDDHLDGGSVLPGFTVSIRDWFAKCD